MIVEGQTRRSALQQRVANAILDAAAHTFASSGSESGMNEIAEVAGVGRATLYRYFPNRQALLEELTEVATSAVRDRLSAARLDGVPVEEGVRRAARALIDVGDYFIVLARRSVQFGPNVFEPILAPITALLDRGQSTGWIRQDLPSEWLAELLVSQVLSLMASQPALGQEDVAAAVTSVFVNGAGARSSEAPPWVARTSDRE